MVSMHARGRARCYSEWKNTYFTRAGEFYILFYKNNFIWQKGSDIAQNFSEQPEAGKTSFYYIKLFIDSTFFFQNNKTNYETSHVEENWKLTCVKLVIKSLYFVLFQDILQTVFENGKLTKEYTFEEIRANAELPSVIAYKQRQELEQEQQSLVS